MDPENTLIYKLVCWLHKKLIRFGKNVNKATGKIAYIRYKIEFGERDDDIYIASYPKSGNTLTQMILYQLTTDGNIDFNHIYDVSPWTRNDAYKNKKPRNLPSPRLIKTHDHYLDFDKATKGRFIYIYRDGMDVAVSLFHQKKNYGKPNLEFDKFLPDIFMNGKLSWFSFNHYWLQNKNKLPILYITYNDLTNHLDMAIRRIIKFCNLDESKIDFARVKERCSFEFMKTHEDKFGEQPIEKKPVMVYDQFIRKGKSGDGNNYFSEEQKEQYNNKYAKYIKEFEEKLIIH
jgi:hypothetical protein